MNFITQSESSARVVNTLLTELDGLDSRKGVHVLAATNRPDMIDPAMCRPGRLDKLLYVDLPSVSERAEITATLLRKLPLGANETEAALARDAVYTLAKDKCDGYSGADLAALVREAGVVALRRMLGTLDGHEEEDANAPQEVRVTLDDFETALGKVQPSVSVGQRRRYEALRSKMAGLPVRTAKEEREEAKA